MSRASTAIVLLAAAFSLGACATSTASPSTGSAPATTPSADGSRATAPSGSARPSAAETPLGSGPDLTSVPTACIGLGADDCRRVIAQAATIVPAGSAVTYIQVGPFGCAAGVGCAPSLAERPQGDITLEAGVGALSYHVTVSVGGAELTINRQDAFGVLLGPESQAPVTAGARPLTLGHCGLWSGWQLVGSGRCGRRRSPRRHQRGRRHLDDPRPGPRDVHVEGRSDGPAGPPRRRQVPATLPVGGAPTAAR